MFGGPSFTGGFLVGFGTGFLTREITRVGFAVAKPMTKAIVKSAITGFEKSRESFSHWSESFEDLVAEVKAGMKQGKDYSTATAKADSADTSVDEKADSTKEAATSHEKKRKHKGSAK